MANRTDFKEVLNLIYDGKYMNFYDMAGNFDDL